VKYEYHSAELGIYLVIDALSPDDIKAVLQGKIDSTRRAIAQDSASLSFLLEMQDDLRGRWA
jgi:hypothetical protein